MDYSAWAVCVCDMWLLSEHWIKQYRVLKKKRLYLCAVFDLSGSPKVNWERLHLTYKDPNKDKHCRKVDWSMERDVITIRAFVNYFNNERLKADAFQHVRRLKCACVCFVSVPAWLQCSACWILSVKLLNQSHSEYSDSQAVAGFHAADRQLLNVPRYFANGNFICT